MDEKSSKSPTDSPEGGFISGPSRKSSYVIDPLELFKIQSDLIHKQINHILLIRSWAGTLTAGIIVAMVSQNQPIFAFGVIPIIMFGLLDYVYGIHFEAYLKREEAIRRWVSSIIPDESARDALSTTASSPRLRKWYYVMMIGSIVALALYLVI